METRRLTAGEVDSLTCHIADNTKTKLEMRKAQAILLLNRRYGMEEIREMTGYERSQVFELRKNFFAEGISSLKDKRKGDPKELLNKQQRNEIIETVQNKKPQECGLFGEYWTTGMLGRWIENKYEVKYKSKTSLYLVFRKAKFTYHKPGRVYDKHNEEDVAQWKTKNQARIQRYWKGKDTVILCADEMILTTETTIQKVWLPQGEFPKMVCTTGGRKRRNVYGFLNIKTSREHAFKTEFQNMYQTRDILEKIRGIYPKQKIVLLWDNAGWHKGSIVQEYIKRDQRIIQIPFPIYAPEENPQEHVWKQGRSQCTHNTFIENIDEATDNLIRYFNETLFPYSLLGFNHSPSS